MKDSGKKRSRSRSKSERKHRDKQNDEFENRGIEKFVDGGVLDDENEPTMGEKLEKLKLMEIESNKDEDKKVALPAPAAPPSADSIHVLLKQALRADDRNLLLDCVYNQDEKVIANSVSQLSSVDVFKLLDFLPTLIQSRGALLVCALPWLKSLLLQHATGIMSQESSLMALNSLYQLMDSRVATFRSAMKLSSCLDFVYTGILDEGLGKEPQTIPIEVEFGSEEDESNDDSDIEEEDGYGKGKPSVGSARHPAIEYEVGSEEEESEEDMETDNDKNGNSKGEPFEGSGSDLEDDNVMSE